MREQRGADVAATVERDRDSDRDREFDQLFRATRRSDAIRVGVVDENAG